MAETDMEAPRLSLLDVVQDRLQKYGKGPLLSRVVFVAKTSERVSSKEDIRAYHETALRKARGEGEPVSGMCVVFPNSVLHVVEAQSKVLLEYLRELHSAPREASHLHDIRIVASTEDIPSRAYVSWHASYVPQPVAESYDAVDKENLIQVVSDVNLSMLKLGHQMSTMTKMEMESRLESLKSQYADLPDVARVMGIVLSEEVPALEDFLDIFDSPVDIDLDEESVWPMPAPLKF